jgi:hypothetical protein
MMVAKEHAMSRLATFILAITLAGGCATSHERVSPEDHGGGRCCTSCHVYRQGGLHLDETAPCPPGAVTLSGDAGVPAAWLADGGR